MLQEHPGKRNLSAHMSRNLVLLDINTAIEQEVLATNAKSELSLQASNKKASKYNSLEKLRQPK